jgi:hypothetical protein
MIRAFKCRAQAIFSLLEKTHPPGSQNLSYITSTQRSYIPKKLDTNSCFTKLRANSYLFSFFYTPCIRNKIVWRDVSIIGISRNLKQAGRQRDDYGYSHNAIPGLLERK